MIFRYSKDIDKNKVDTLLKVCFGDRSNVGALDDLINRYLLAFDNDDNLIAMTGITKKHSQFNGYEIDWTCCHPSYRRQGIISQLLKKVLSDVAIDEPIYCSAWHHANKEFANLHNILTGLDFSLIRCNYKFFMKKHMKQCTMCTQCLGDTCSCVEDLYVKIIYDGEVDELA